MPFFFFGVNMPYVCIHVCISISFFLKTLRNGLKFHEVIQTCMRSGIAIWGHSMGAAAALMHTETNSSIQALILDSCFATMRQLVRDAVVSAGKEGFGLPNFVVEAGIQALR